MSDIFKAQGQGSKANCSPSSKELIIYILSHLAGENSLIYCFTLVEEAVLNPAVLTFFTAEAEVTPWTYQSLKLQMYSPTAGNQSSPTKKNILSNLNLNRGW